jgi:hypothetical protein
VRVVAVSSDRLFPPHRQQELAQAIRSGVTMTKRGKPARARWLPDGTTEAGTDPETVAGMTPRIQRCDVLGDVCVHDMACALGNRDSEFHQRG